MGLWALPGEVDGDMLEKPVASRGTESTNIWLEKHLHDQNVSCSKDSQVYFILKTTLVLKRRFTFEDTLNLLIELWANRSPHS